MTSIDVRDLTKEYGPRRAVDRLTFSVRPSAALPTATVTSPVARPTVSTGRAIAAPPT
ncbi:hypothetical protein JHN52_00285 [Streptomyces sp. MBT97]|uniref:hypothetical protein n=1 Tax=Streptomyces sp. MBT97 TaxID=2800411 RepID=UPI00190CF3E5|nr:hypothetical protein [Streptomyces sp. MBT97]MBK3631421.1 hypothetical protein [Streptomyces sp. MBT97]